MSFATVYILKECAMSKVLDEFLEHNLEAKAFDLFRRGRKIPFHLLIYLGVISSIRDTFHWFIRNIPGPIGTKSRLIYYKITLKVLGKNCLLDEGVRIDGPQNISISDYVWIDKNVSLSAAFGYIHIGKRVHIAPYSHIAGGGGVEIGDYVGISSGVKIYSHSETPRDGKRMSGPMVPEEMKGLITKKVTLEKDAFLGTNAVILPGITIGEGAVVAANSLVIKSVKPYVIVAGVPAKPIGVRKKVTVQDDI